MQMETRRKFTLSEPDLRRLYVDDKVLVKDIAAIDGVSVATVMNWLAKYGIKRNHRFNYVHIPEDELRRLYLVEKMTCVEIGRRYGCSNHSVAVKLRDAGVVITIADTRARQIEANKVRYKHEYEVRGYKQVKRPDHPSANADGYVAEHRMVIEDAIGRRLRSEEEVHHLNFERADNRIENLLMLGCRVDHATVHKYMERVGAHLLGLSDKRPDPVRLCRPAFFRGNWVNEIDLIGDRVANPDDLDKKRNERAVAAMVAW